MMGRMGLLRWGASELFRDSSIERWAVSGTDGVRAARRGCWDVDGLGSCV